MKITNTDAIAKQARWWIRKVRQCNTLALSRHNVSDIFGRLTFTNCLAGRQLVCSLKRARNNTGHIIDINAGKQKINLFIVKYYYRPPAGSFVTMQLCSNVELRKTGNREMNSEINSEFLFQLFFFEWLSALSMCLTIDSYFLNTILVLMHYVIKNFVRIFIFFYKKSYIGLHDT